MVHTWRSGWKICQNSIMFIYRDDYYNKEASKAPGRGGGGDH